MTSLRRHPWAPPLLLACLAGCSASPDGTSAGAPGSAESISSTSPVEPAGPPALTDPLGTIDIEKGGSLDVPFTTVEREFWTPPTFTGDGCTGEAGVWGETVQRALWFLNVNRSGPGITHRFIQWRGDSHMEDAHIKLIADDRVSQYLAR